MNKGLLSVSELEFPDLRLLGVTVEWTTLLTGVKRSRNRAGVTVGLLFAGGWWH